ncbi:MAG TPA: hypothetical protein VHS78_14575 [Candidatus Elarobacter sp.]|nr:hypothetical protein [Candidatus Elarobacter sp.]
MKRALTAAAAALLLTTAVPQIARSAPAQGSAQLNYKVLPTVKAQVTPNYLSGYGPQGGLGSGVTPAAGPNASLQGGTVDFGNVVVGYTYLYKYAAQVAVQTNDSAGFVVYGEGATDLNGSNPVPAPSTWPIFSTLYWLPSSSANSPFSAATSFNKTNGSPIAGGANGIDYSGTGGVPSAMSVVWSNPTSGNVTQGYDYQLRLSGAVPPSQFNVYIVYTVIGN